MRILMAIITVLVSLPLGSHAVSANGKVAEKVIRNTGIKTGVDAGAQAARRAAMETVRQNAAINARRAVKQQLKATTSHEAISKAYKIDKPKVVTPLRGNKNNSQRLLDQRKKLKQQSVSLETKNPAAVGRDAKLKIDEAKKVGDHKTAANLGAVAKKADDLAAINKKRTLDNIAASRKARESSGFKKQFGRVKPKPAVVHKNSLNYVGETHVYSIRRADGTLKIGESAIGKRIRDGASKRAEQQARKLRKETGMVHETRIRKIFPGKKSARTYETKLIERYRRRYGSNALPGNKTNR